MTQPTHWALVSISKNTKGQAKLCIEYVCQDAELASTIVNLYMRRLRRLSEDNKKQGLPTRVTGMITLPYNPTHAPLTNFLYNRDNFFDLGLRLFEDLPISEGNSWRIIKFANLPHEVTTQLPSVFTI